MQLCNCVIFPIFVFLHIFQSATIGSMGRPTFDETPFSVFRTWPATTTIWEPFSDTTHFDGKRSHHVALASHIYVYLHGAQHRVVFFLETVNLQVRPISFVFFVFEQLCLNIIKLPIFSNDQLPSDGPYVCCKKAQWLSDESSND